MNKYDATQAWSAGSATKLSMDYQQTASNQSSVSTGTRNIHDDADSIKHEGSTWIQGPNGQQYELNGTFKQTAAGWEASGTFIDQNGKSWSGTMTGTAKNMEAFQNNVKNGDEAVLQAMSIDTSNLSRSQERHQDNISTANTVDQANNTFERKDVYDTRDITRRGSETVEGDKFTHDSSINVVTGVKEDHSDSYSSGTKVSVGDTVNDYTGGLAMLQNGLSKFGANQGLMKEAFVDNMTKYQDSILQKAGNDAISEQQALAAAGKFQASVGFEALGNGASVGFDAALRASVDHSSGQVDTANLNRLMNENIMKQLDADAKANNWTAEQYDQAAKERFGAYNDFLKNELGGQVYGPGNASYEVLDGTKNMVGTAANAAGKAADKMYEIGEGAVDKILK